MLHDENITNGFLFGHVDIATRLVSIEKILRQQGKYKEGLDYVQRTLEMQEKCYPSGHAHISESLVLALEIFFIIEENMTKLLIISTEH